MQGIQERGTRSEERADSALAAIEPARVMAAAIAGFGGNRHCRRDYHGLTEGLPRCRPDEWVSPVAAVENLIGVSAAAKAIFTEPLRMHVAPVSVLPWDLEAVVTSRVMCDITEAVFASVNGQGSENGAPLTYRFQRAAAVLAGECQRVAVRYVAPGGVDRLVCPKPAEFLATYPHEREKTFTVPASAFDNLELCGIAPNGSAVVRAWLPDSQFASPTFTLDRSNLFVAGVTAARLEFMAGALERIEGSICGLAAEAHALRADITRCAIAYGQNVRDEACDLRIMREVRRRNKEEALTWSAS